MLCCAVLCCAVHWSCDAHTAATPFLGRAWGGHIVAFIAVIPSFGRLARDVSMRRREHRVVVLPDYQGVGFGSRLSDAVAFYFTGIKDGAQYV